VVHGSQKRTPNGAAPLTAGRVTNFAGTSAIAGTPIDATRNIKPTSVGNTKDDARHSRRNNNHKPTSVGTRREPAINAGSRIFTRIFTSHPTITTSQYNSLEKTERPYVNQQAGGGVTGPAYPSRAAIAARQKSSRMWSKHCIESHGKLPRKWPKKSQPTENHQQTRWKIQRIVKQRPGRPEFDEHELVAAPSPGNDDQKY